eukprot:Tbor_TRINITY_DN5555_c4_g1::TRINITY_DN5555_c4_g1_i1::g.13293::m.13293
MVQLRSKLKTISRRTKHRIKISNRKQQRKEKTDDERRADGVNNDINKLSKEFEDELEKMYENGQMCDDNGGNPSEENAMKRYVGGLMVQQPQLSKKKTKNLTRKQQKRKEKGQSKGAAVTEQMKRKWSIKKMRVKIRAQVRNSELHNE